MTKFEKLAVAIIYSIYTQLRTLSTSVAALRTTDVYIWLYLSPSGSRLGRPWPLVFRSRPLDPIAVVDPVIQQLIDHGHILPRRGDTVLDPI